MNQLTPWQERYERDRQVWECCADTYEERIVGGHPDVLAYEAFEEDLLDRVLYFLARERNLKLRLYDVGCGSGRLHLRYGLKFVDTALLPEDDAFRVSLQRASRSDYAHDPLLAEHLVSIGGVDFSSEMLALARNKLYGAGLASMLETKLQFERGSAFDLQPLALTPIPVVVCVCNSIGVMQGPDGAVKLFEAFKRAVLQAGGIGIISAYRREAVGAYGLSNYESTMDVCGQPLWLSPDTYAGAAYKQVPRFYKRSRDPDPIVEVDVYDRAGKLVVASHQLLRNDDTVRTTLETGHIRTHTNYESFWYSFEQFDSWIESCWSGHKSFHLAGRELDALRGEPAQFAILDPNEHLSGLFERLLRPRTPNR